MKRLLFMTSSATIGVFYLAGCMTSNDSASYTAYTMVNAQGKEVVVKVPTTYKTVDARGREKTVSVEEPSVKKIGRTLAKEKNFIESELKEKVAQGKFFTKYRIPSDAKLQELAGVTLTGDEMEMLRKESEKIMREAEKAIVWPAWIAQIRAKALPAAEKVLAEGRYELAREIIWKASTTTVPEVDEAVREFGIEFLNTRVNPAQWKVIESELRKRIASFVEKGEFAEAKDFLKGYPRIRTYSKSIDKRLEAVQGEVVKLGIDAKGIDPIRQKTGNLVEAAAKIVDIRDTVTNTVTKIVRDDSVNPDLESYERALEDYRKTLVRYNCTETNANLIVASFKKSIEPLLKGLAKDATTDTLTKEYPFLGTMAVNKRTDTLVGDLNKEVRQAEIAAAVAAMRRKAMALLADGKYEESREVVWQAAATGDAEIDATVFTNGVDLLRREINPAQWRAIEDEIKTTVAEKIAADEYEACLAFLKGYPRIRQHSAALDEQLKKVRIEAEALGADSDEAVKRAQIACDLVAEAQRLVDNLDLMEAGEQPSEEDKTAYQKELEAYAAKLSLYHAEPEHVRDIVATLDAALRELMRKPNEPATKLVLGTNAVNDRLANLIREQLALVGKAKGEWQERQFNALYTSLIERVCKAVSEDDYAGARDAIRDEKLVGVPVADAKLYALRVGLLNSVVNPRQLAYLLPKIDEKVTAFVQSKDFKGLKAFVVNYPYVHDTYDQIQASLENIKSTIVDLDLTEETSSEYVGKVDALITALLEGREGKWSPEFDFKALEAALDELAKSLMAQYYRDAEVKAFCEQIKQDVDKLLTARFAPMTTAELNAALASKLAPTLVLAETGLREQAYLALLDQMDQEVSMDAQIAMAEEGVSRQLGISCEKASYEINAVLGEYARAFRLLKKNATLSAAEATSILLGAAYLDQAAVIPFALKLGADVNGVSARDPRKRTALMLALDAQHLSLMKALSEAGVNAKATDANGNSVLHYAAKSGNIAAVRALAKVASIEVVNNDGETPLFAAVRRNQQAMICALVGLLESKDARAAFVNKTAKSGLTAFALAAKLGSRDVLDPLAEAGATYSEQDLILAEEGDHLAVAQWLVAQGADVNADGVMAKACPATATGRYLIHEGGVGSHACTVCKPEKKVSEPQVKPTDKAEATGTITFKVEEAK